MILVAIMLAAFCVAVVAVGSIGLFAHRESQLFSVMTEEVHAVEERRRENRRVA